MHAIKCNTFMPMYSLELDQGTFHSPTDFSLAKLCSREKVKCFSQDKAIVKAHNRLKNYDL